MKRNDTEKETRRYRKSYDVDKLRILAESGKPRDEIANILGVSRSTVDKAIRKYGLLETGNRGRKPKKCDEKQLREYVESEKTNQEIAVLMGVSKTTVEQWIRKNNMLGIRRRGGNNRKPEAERKRPEEKQTFSGWNKDRHLCKFCKYRAGKQDKLKGFGCDYIEITGRSRGCGIEDCNVYEKGNPDQRVKRMVLK